MNFETSIFYNICYLNARIIFTLSDIFKNLLRDLKHKIIYLILIFFQTLKKTKTWCHIKLYIFWEYNIGFCVVKNYCRKLLFKIQNIFQNIVKQVNVSHSSSHSSGTNIWLITGFNACSNYIAIFVFMSDIIELFVTNNGYILCFITFGK